MAIRAVVFDWGGVLTPPMDVAFRAWLELDGVRPEHFGSVIQEWLGLGTDRMPLAGVAPVDSPIHAIERGQVTTAEFEALLADALRRRGAVVSAEGLVARMLAGLATLDESMMNLVREVRRQGLATALLSNSWGEHYPRELFDGLFDAVVISGREGTRKPEPAIFRLAADRLGVRLQECLFVDDLTVNVEAAVAVGMRAVHHTSVADTRDAVLAALSRGDE